MGLDEKLIPVANTKHSSTQETGYFKAGLVFMNKISSYNFFFPNNSLHGPVVMSDK